jgi:hypothetical protein
LRFGYLSTIIWWFRVIWDLVLGYMH